MIFMPTVPGGYQLRATSEAGTDAETVSFYISPNFPFQEDKLQLNEGSINQNNFYAVVNNQVWLYSRSLDQLALEQIVSEFPSFSIVGYEPAKGLLLQYSDINTQNEATLETLRLTSGITSVNHRIVTGPEYVHDPDLTPDDGSRFDDGGGNWHLEKIGAEAAWDISTGSRDVRIAISESTPTFFIDHEDLVGQLDVGTRAVVAGNESHASAVAGTIGAISNNGFGMSGINWVSPIAAGGSGEASIIGLSMDDRYKVINSSWSLFPAPPEGTDIDDEDIQTQRRKLALQGTGDYRNTMSEKSNILYVNSAGNGVKGAGGKGFDGRMHSPATHYTEYGSFEPIANVLFVAAMQEDGRLRFSSNYGESVQIAAPTRYESIEGPNGYGTFGGTSAAAPVVSGVASLIFSLSPNFSASEVKRILINSATEFVTERHAESSNSGSTELLETPIPILNAAAALKLAEEFALGNKATVVQTINNPFTEFTDIEVLAATGEYQAKGFSFTRNGNTALGRSGGSSATLMLEDPGSALSIASNDVVFNDPISGTDFNSRFDVVLENPDILLELVDGQTNQPIGNADITIEPVNVYNAKYDIESGIGNAIGVTRLYLMSGAYRIIVNSPGYEEHRTLVSIVNEGQKIEITLAMNPLTEPMNGIDPTQPADEFDPCIVGTWVLDNQYMEQQLKQNDPELVELGGKQTLEFLDTGVAKNTLRQTYLYSRVEAGDQITTSSIHVGDLKYSWRTSDGMFFGDTSTGDTLQIDTTITVNGVAQPSSSRTVPVPAAVTMHTYSCTPTVLVIDPPRPGFIAVRYVKP